MLMRNPEYKIQDEVETKHGIDEPFVIRTPREILLGQTILMLSLIIAILLRAMA